MQILESNQFLASTPAGQIPKLRREQALTTCPYCQKLIEPLLVNSNLGQFYIARQHCNCEMAQAAKLQAEKQRQAQEFKEKFDQLMQQARVYQVNESSHGYLAKVTLKNWHALATNLVPGEQAKLNAVMKYVHAIHAKDEGKRLLVLSGPPGVGKTHLAIGIIKRLAGMSLQLAQLDDEYKPTTAFFAPWMAFISELKGSFDEANRDAETELRLMNYAKYRGILVLDDVDKVKPTEWALAKLYEIIDYRTSHNKATVITMNHLLDNGAQGLKYFLMQGQADLGAVIYDRIMGELWGEVVLKGTSYREVMAAEGAA